MLLPLLAFIVGAVACTALSAVARRVATRLGIVVPPRPDRWHQEPTPTMGGVAIAIATGLAMAVLALAPARVDPPMAWLAVPMAALAMLSVGLADDRRQLSPLAKLVFSLVVGAFLVFALKNAERPGLSVVQTVVAIVWFAGVCHATNLLDNMDGLLTGVGAIAALFLAAVFAPAVGTVVTVLLAGLAGALGGFLIWNRVPARLFMGDAGSLFIGAVLGGAGLLAVFEAGTIPAALASSLGVVLVLIVPLFDTSFVLVLRRLAGRPATKGGTDHVSHRIAALGFSQRSTVRILYIIGFLGGVTAWVLAAWGWQVTTPVAAIFLIALALVGIYLARVPAYTAGEDFQALQRSAFAPLIKDLTFRWHFGQVLLDIVLIVTCFYAAYRLRFEGQALDVFLPSFTVSLPVVVGLKLTALYASGLYQRSWQTFGLRDLASAIRGVVGGSVLSILAAIYVYRFERFSRGVFIIDAVLLFLAIFATRVSFRAMGQAAMTRNKKCRRVLVYGAGGFGQLLVRELRANPAWNMNPVAFVDDDPMKARRWINGVPVRGGFERFEELLERESIDEVVISSPAINGTREQQIRALCAARDLAVRRLHLEIG